MRRCSQSQRRAAHHQSRVAVERMALSRGKPLADRRDIILNGKFLGASGTGVHRVARELLVAIDALVTEDTNLAKSFSFSILSPPNARSTLGLKTIPTTNRGPLTWQFWEQIELPMLARGRQLVNLCNLAPVFRTGDITLVHDAQVYLSPASYSWAFRSWYQVALPLIGRRSAAIITVSDFSRRMLASVGIAPVEKISVVHNGVDHMARIQADNTILDRLRLAPHRYVVALANVQVHKNIAVLLQTFANPALADVRLVLVGDSSKEKFAEAGLDVPPNVVFAGILSDAALRGLFEQAACLAFPSTTEGFGLPPLEAMYVGCPAIVAPCGALPETCGAHATFAAPDDPGAWAKAITRFVDDPELRANAGADGQRHAEAFTWRRSAEAVLKVVADAAPRQAQRLRFHNDRARPLQKAI